VRLHRARALLQRVLAPRLKGFAPRRGGLLGGAHEDRLPTRVGIYLGLHRWRGGRGVARAHRPPSGDLRDLLGVLDSTRNVVVLVADGRCSSCRAASAIGCMRGWIRNGSCLGRRRLRQVSLRACSSLAFEAMPHSLRRNFARVRGSGIFGMNHRRRSGAVDHGMGPGFQSHQNQRDNGKGHLKPFRTPLLDADFAPAPLC